MQEHIRRAHPNHYIPKLPATEESFLMMVNTPLEQRVQLSPPEPPQPRRPHGQFFLFPFLFTFYPHPNRDTDGYRQMWRRKERSMLRMAPRPPLELSMNPTQLRPLQQLRWHNYTTTAWPRIGIQTWFVFLGCLVGFRLLISPILTRISPGNPF
jgi:hypothetical protein